MLDILTCSIQPSECGCHSRLGVILRYVDTHQVALVVHVQIKLPRLTNEKVWSISCFLGCEQDPLGKDARTQIAEYDQHKDNLRNEVTQHVDRLAEVSARTTLMWHFRHQHKYWAAWIPEQLLLLQGHQLCMVKAHMCTISTYL